MGQVAFDTQKFVETLEKTGLKKEQAKAISLVVRKSHEVSDLATKADINDVKRDIADVRKDFSAEIVGVKRDLEDVRKDLSTEIADVRKDIEARFEKNEAKTEAQISLIRKDLQLEMAGIRSEQTLMRWMLGFGVIGILSLVVKAFLIPAL